MAENHEFNNQFLHFNGVEEDFPSYPFTLTRPPLGLVAPFNPLNPPLNPLIPNQSADPTLLLPAFNRLNLSNNPPPDPAALLSQIQYLQDRIRDLEIQVYNEGSQQSLLRNFNNSHTPHSNSLNGGGATRCFCNDCQEDEILVGRRGGSRAQRRGGSLGMNGIDNHMPRLQFGSNPPQFQRLLNPALNTPLEEFRGNLAAMAKDQNGCRYLQKKVEGGNIDEIDMIFVEIKKHICELMVDQSGNYLVQKLLDTCDGEQRNDIVLSVTKYPNVFVSISCNMYGTRTMQKLLERLANVDQQTRVIIAMKPATVVLVTDAHGHHVVQYCLKKFPNELKKYIIDEVAAHSVEIARHQNGCCVLQSSMQYSYGEIKEHLLAEIAKNSLALSQDPYGNYVVQYLLDMKVPQYTTRVLNSLEGNYVLLSMQKCSSHVVEKCLIQSSQIEFNQIVRELITSPDILKLLQDAFGNYVVQCALKVSFKTRAFFEIVSMTRKHDTSLRSHPYGKRILHLIEQLIR